MAARVCVCTCTSYVQARVEIVAVQARIGVLPPLCRYFKFLLDILDIPRDCKPSRNNARPRRKSYVKIIEARGKISGETSSRQLIVWEILLLGIREKILYRLIPVRGGRKVQSRCAKRSRGVYTQARLRERHVTDAPYKSEREMPRGFRRGNYNCDGSFLSV